MMLTHRPVLLQLRRDSRVAKNSFYVQHLAVDGRKSPSVPSGRIDGALQGNYPSGGRPDVLVHPEQVRGVVLLLDGREPIVVVAIGGPHSRIALIVHHEVDVPSAGIDWMQRLP